MMGAFKFIICFFIFILLSIGIAFSNEKKDDKKIEVPSPMEIRDYHPLANGTLIIEYANEREFLYRIVKIKPRPECNQVKVDDDGKIIIITQAPSQTYEYILEPVPFMVSEWIRYEK